MVRRPVVSRVPQNYTPLRTLIIHSMFNILLGFISTKIKNNSQGGHRKKDQSLEK